MMQVKICGITNIEDGLTCVRYGVSAVGFVFAKSKRQVTVERAFYISKKLPPFITKIGVFVDEKPEVIKEILKTCRLDLAQLHGSESPSTAEALDGRAIKVFKGGSGKPDMIWKDVSLRAVLIDTFSPSMAGGTGQTFDWHLFSSYRALGHPLILAGGLKNSNILKAIEIAKPDGVDLSGGVEKSPGIKDPAMISELMKTLKLIPSP